MFTKGPWKRTTSPSGDGRSIEAQAFDGSWKFICDKVRGGTPEQAEANAQLIAAAPDLLEVVRALVHVSEHPRDGINPLDENSPLMDAARTAILKATPSAGGR